MPELTKEEIRIIKTSPPGKYLVRVAHHENDLSGDAYSLSGYEEKLYSPFWKKTEDVFDQKVWENKLENTSQMVAQHSVVGKYLLIIESKKNLTHYPSGYKENQGGTFHKLGSGRIPRDSKILKAFSLYGREKVESISNAIKEVIRTRLVSSMKEKTIFTRETGSQTFIKSIEESIKEVEKIEKKLDNQLFWLSIEERSLKL